MVECEKQHGFRNVIKNGLSFVSQIVSSSIFSPISDGAEKIIKSIEDKMLQLEKRIMRKIYPLLLIGFGGTFLIFALFFFLIETLSWTRTASFFFIGITIFVAGLLLKIIESAK